MNNISEEPRWMLQVGFVEILSLGPGCNQCITAWDRIWGKNQFPVNCDVFILFYLVWSMVDEKRKRGLWERMLVTNTETGTGDVKKSGLKDKLRVDKGNRFGVFIQQNYDKCQLGTWTVITLSNLPTSLQELSEFYYSPLAT